MAFGGEDWDLDTTAIPRAALESFKAVQRVFFVSAARSGSGGGIHDLSN
jgi:hypothetical protein